LIGTVESAAAEKDAEIRMAREKICRGFEHQRLAEVVLYGGVFEISGWEERAANFVFIEHDTMTVRGKGAGKRAFAGARKAGHEDDHATEPV
jgi:hypothetical protein